ncbi:YggT family protein [Synechocystis salina LEGE 06099]|uniref:YggT family protein n=1 Tax=Synechocystis salina TaxID=945780 RepID=UPI0018801459|nr:YggT family protein [Synechocystis salina]MBE9204618.1 YggT family protein [Synechocystis salina LEGE 06099]
MNYAAIAGQGLGILLALMTVLFIFRIILTWYPQVELTKWPWKLIALPTEPLLIPLRKLVPPIGGVDLAPILWVFICTFLREILIGQQGLITMPVGCSRATVKLE